MHPKFWANVTIEYSIDNGIITLKITDADGNITEIQLPIGDFSF